MIWLHQIIKVNLMKHNSFYYFFLKLQNFLYLGTAQFYVRSRFSLSLCQQFQYVFIILKIDFFSLSTVNTYMEPQQQSQATNSEHIQDPFLESKLFNEALSKPTSHYIQSKLLSMPKKQVQDLKKLDLRHMCDTVVQELEVIQKEAAYDYIKVSEQLQLLGFELTKADGIMAQLETVLTDFKSHLESIKNQMTSLQQKSNQMNTSLNNRKKLQTMLNSFIDSAVLDKQLIDAICLNQINDDYVVHIKSLLKKLGYLNNNMIAPDSKAVKELQPQLQKLKSRASVRLREFILDQISLLKKPKTNINIVQKNVLSKYKIFTEFFKDHSPGIFTEVCNVYRETMAKIYLGNFKVYLAQIYKLQVQLYLKTDHLIPLDPQHLRPFLQQIKPTNLNQGKSTIFTLMGRQKTVDQNQSADVILYNVATVKNQKFTIEQIFKSVNKVLMDGVLNQVIFTAQFFNVKSQGAIELFGPIFRPSLNIFLDHVKQTVAVTFDLYGLLLILAINQKNKQTFREKHIGALDFYFDQISMIVWPKFDELFEMHMKGFQAISTRQYRVLQKAVSSKILIQRFSDFMLALYRLHDYFPDSKMIGVRIENVRKSFFDLQKKIKSEAERQSDGFNQYLSFLQQFHSALASETNCKGKDYHDQVNRIEKQIGQISDRIVLGYIKDFFPNLQNFIKKYCTEQNIGQQGGFTIQQNIQQKVLDLIISDISGQPLSNGLQKVLTFCQKSYSGYSLKSLLKKFMGVFMKYYTQIYKYIKNNYAEAASMMLQPHNTMKQIKNVFGKHIS